MAESATILIPDISGYTEFLTRTELTHSTHIINELLEAILAANGNEFALAEIEGDALLLCRTGKPLEAEALVRQCVAMFQSFHAQLKVIERDSLCQCGACKGATNLNLKFVAHHGEVQRIKVLNFTKCSGIDMVVAHRLLKNQVDSNEYILATRSCFDAAEAAQPPGGLAWQAASDDYAAIGTVAYNYAPLEGVRKAMPALPPRRSPVIDLGRDAVAMEVDAPMLAIYQLVIDLDQRTRWLSGEERVERPPVTERIGMRHVCVFRGLNVEWVAVKCERSEDRITYVEEGRIVEMDLPVRAAWVLEPLAEGRTSVTFRMKWLCDPEPPRELTESLMADLKASLETIKTICESGEGAPASIH